MKEYSLKCIYCYRKIRMLLELPFEKQKMLWVAMLVIMAIKIGLAIFPFDKLHRMLFRQKLKWKESGNTIPGGEEESHFIDLSIWAVLMVGNFFLKRKCLTQALACKLLLISRSIESDLIIGFIGTGKIHAAHAWLELQGRVIVGDAPDLLEYIQIPKRY